MATDGPDESAASTPAVENVQDLRIDDDMRASYLSYAMSVIISRALPDVRDGLKPSQRRILLAMNDLNLHARAKEAKCARICGDTSGKYHPHGESVVYPTLVRLAQPFTSRYPLVAGQGNFGSIDGLPPAAMRYTEARMSQIADAMLEDIEKDTVDTVPNYDETRQEAVVLPAKVPNLLVNGGTGIAVGMATSIPPHNLGEVCDAVTLLIDNPEATLADLLQVIPGPDFPTGGIIRGRRGIVEGYRTGRSTFSVRAKCHFEESRTGQTNIIVTEIPYMQQKIRLVQKIAQAVKDDRVSGIRNVQDHSDRTGGLRITIELKRDANPDVVLNQLYQFTPLQDTTSVIMLALVSGRPQTLSLRQILQEFLKHRVTVIRRRTQFLLRKARDRAHVLEGLLIALSSIDDVIERIRTSSDVPTARERLMGLEVSAQVLSRALGDEGFAAFQAIVGARAAYNLTRVQADHILQMQLQRLTALEQDKLAGEYQELRTQITGYERLLSSEANILAVVRADMQEIKRRFGDPRRTQIVEQEGDITDEDLIADEMAVVTISHAGYIKRMPLTTYRTQGRGGKGVTGGKTKEGDFLADFIVASTHDYILFFTDRGQCYWLKVYDIPQFDRAAQGRAIVNVLTLRPEERITSHIPVRDFDDSCLFMITRRGVVKKTPLRDYSRPKQGGIIGISLDEGDELIEVLLTRPGNHVVLSTRRGRAIRFDEAKARSMGRNTHGVRGIRLAEDDEVVGGVVVNPEATLLTVCEYGFGKRSNFDDYRMTGRGGGGIKDIKTTERNGNVVAVASVLETDHVLLISIGGMVVRMRAADIKIIGRNTQGVRLMRMRDGDRVTGLARISAEEAEEDDTPEVAPLETEVLDADEGEELDEGESEARDGDSADEGTADSAD